MSIEFTENERRTHEGRDPIFAPAVRIAGKVHAVPRPKDDDAHGVSSMMHVEAALHAEHIGATTREAADRDLRDPANMGFVTRSGKYLSRKDAVPHVFAHNQFRIKNEKDDQLIALKTKLKSQMASGHPDPFLDSFDIDYFAKSQARFEELENHKSDEFHAVQVRVTHPNGKQGMDLHMMRSHDDPEGHWSLVNVDPVDHTLSIDGPTHGRAFSNRLGPAVVRQAARHLKATYGVTKVSGFRMTGARFAGQADDAKSIDERDSQRITVPIAKGYGRGDALQPWRLRKKKGPIKFNEDPIEIIRSTPSPMRDKFNAPVEKALVVTKRTLDSKVKVPSEKLHIYDFHVAEGPKTHKGVLSISLEDDGSTGYINYIGMKSDNEQAGRGAFGVSHMRQMVRHLKNEHPNLKRLEGHRVSGVKAKSSYEKPWHQDEISQKLRNPTRELSKSWVDAGDKPAGNTQWSVKPFNPMFGGKPKGGIQHAHISAPGNRGAIMSFKHSAKTGHTEILAFRAHTFHDEAFKAGFDRMKEGASETEVDNTIEYHRSNVGRIGAGGIRAAARYLKDTLGSKTVGGTRVSGTRVNNKNELPKAPTRRAGDLESLPGVKVKRALEKALFDVRKLSANPVSVPQEPVKRNEFSKPSSFAKYDETVQRTLGAWNSASNKKRLETGIKAQGHEWYHMDPLHHKFRERHGEKEGSRRFNLFMDTIAATSHNSEFGSNMRRAGALFPFMLHGGKDRKLSSNEGINHLLGPRLGNTSHRDMASALQAVREGKSSMTKDPLKVDGFAANLRGNFEPLTADRHVGRQSGHPNKTSNSIVYQGIEDATKFHASELARRGKLPVASGRSATAAFQSALWIGDALTGRVKSEPHPALVDFEQHIHTAAQQAGIKPTQALDRFMDGELHEFGGGVPGLRAHVNPGRVQKAIDIEALEDEFEPRPGHAGGKEKKGRPVGSRTDQARHQVPAYNATKTRVEKLKKEGKL